MGDWLSDLERLGRRPTGDIRNFPRKDRLEEQIQRAIIDSTEVQVVERIIVHGSWGRGKAVPFSSDLDIIAQVRPVPSPTGGSGEYRWKFWTDEYNRFLVFNGFDIWLTFSENYIDDMKDDPMAPFGEEPYRYSTENVMERLVSEKEPHIAYDLTLRETIEIGRGGDK